MEENNILNNLPPFYVGQRVVGLMNHYDIVKDEIYSVTNLKQICNCGLCININNISCSELNTNKIVKSGTLVVCTICGIKYITDGLQYYKTTRFAPLQQQSFPLIELIKVIEKEKQFVSSN